MVGKPFKKCPNRKICKANAKLNNCHLPYQVFSSLYGDELFNRTTLIVQEPVSREAYCAGWCVAESIDKYIFYSEETLWVGGRDIYHNIYSGIQLPKELKILGWEISEPLPYAFYDFWVDSDKQCHYYLEVTTYNLNHQDFGWYRAVSLPYFKSLNHASSSGKIFDYLYVNFSLEDPEYVSAIALGWHPSIPINLPLKFKPALKPA